MANVKMLDGKYCKDEELRDGISEVKAYIGYPDDNVLGLSADFENSTFTRLAAAKGLNAGSDFNVFKMYGDRKLCNLADDGTITAWYGDPNYTETGYTTIVDPDTKEESTIQVQVMVRQPKFYYKVVPIKLDPITSTDPTQTGVHGYSGVKMNYYISDKPLPGFKLHPAFINANGDEVDCYYIGAYEASLFDVSENRYLKYDSWDVTYDEQTDTYTVNSLNAYVADSSADMFSSIAGVRPANGAQSNLTRSAAKAISRRRGTGWEPLSIKMLSAEQLLFIIEYASFNSQSALGTGCATRCFTGSTTNIGNDSGIANKTYRLDGTTGEMYEYTNVSDVAVRYRGVENLWCNTYTYIEGITLYPRDQDYIGRLMICKNFNYAETASDNYEDVGFSPPYVSSSPVKYGKYFGYSADNDWIFFIAKTGGKSNLPIGDSVYTNNQLSAYRVVLFSSGNTTPFGLFMFYTNRIRTESGNAAGARLCYV